MKRFCLIVLIPIFLIPFSAIAQEITIRDINTKLPISNAAVFHKDKSFSTLTGMDGHLSLKNISEGKVTIQHTAYYRESVFIESLKEGNNNIYLTPKVIQLDQFVISANKWEQPKEEVPSKITTISREQIQLFNPQTAGDILANSNEVFVQKSQMAGGSPMIRGFSTNAVLLMVDGIRLNNAIYRSGNVQNVINIDPNILEGTEVIFGPGSVMYGSDALGGVMDFHIFNPEYSDNDSVLFKANASAGYSSANVGKSLHGDFSVATTHFKSFTSFSWSDFQDLEMGSKGNDNEQYLRSWYVDRINGIDSIFSNPDPNIQKQSAYSQYHITQKMSWQASKNLELAYLFYYSSTSDLPRYDQLRVLSNGEPKYAEWYYGPQNLAINSLSATLKKKTALFDKAKTAFTWQEYRESRHTRKFQNDNLLSQNEAVSIASLNIDFEKDFTNGLSLIYGTEIIYNGLDSDASEYDITNDTYTNDFVLTRYPDGDNVYNAQSLYSGLRYKKNKLIYNAGARLTNTTLRSSFENAFYSETFGYNQIKNNNQAITGSAGITWLPGNNTACYINVSSGFHAPNWDGLAKVFTPKKGVVIVPNENLLPEYAYNGEAGITQHLFNKRITLEGNIFYTFLDNAVVQRSYEINNQSQLIIDGDTNAVEAYVNASYAHLYGFNLALHSNITTHLGIRSHLSYTHSRDAEGYSLRHAAPLFGATHVIYKQHMFTADVNVVYNAAILAENLAPSEQGKDNMYAINENGELWSPSWYTVNLSVSWQTGPHLMLNGGVENIFDARYRPYSSGICAPGRSLSISLKATF